MTNKIIFAAACALALIAAQTNAAAQTVITNAPEAIKTAPTLLKIDAVQINTGKDDGQIKPMTTTTRTETDYYNENEPKTLLELKPNKTAVPSAAKKEDIKVPAETIKEDQSITATASGAIGLSPQPDPPGLQLREKITAINTPMANSWGKIIGKEISVKTIQSRPVLFVSPQNSAEATAYAANNLGKVEPTVIFTSETGKMTKMIELIEKLSIGPEQLFTPELGKTTNILVNPTAVEEKMVYELSLDTDKPVYKDKQPETPLINLNVNRPVEFKVKDNAIIINNEQIINYEKLASVLKNKEAIPPMRIKLQSGLADNAIYEAEVNVVPSEAKVTIKENDKIFVVRVEQNFAVDGAKLYLHDQEGKNKILVKVLPNELASALGKAKEKNIFSDFSDLKLSTRDEQAIYNVKVKKPFKLLGIIPIVLNSQYEIESTSGILIKEKKPWYSFAGKLTTMPIATGINFIEAYAPELSLMELPPINIVSFAATPNRLDREFGPVELSWNVENASQINLETTNRRAPILVTAPLPARGTLTLNPSITNTYRLTARNSRGADAVREIDVQINLPDLVIDRLEPNTPSTRAGERGYDEMKVIIKNIGSMDFTGVLHMDITCHLNCYYSEATRAVFVPRFNTYTFYVNRGRVTGSGDIDRLNFISGQTYNFDISFTIDRWREEFKDNNRAAISYTVPNY